MRNKVIKWVIVIALIFVIGIVLKAVKEVQQEEIDNYNPYEKLGN